MVESEDGRAWRVNRKSASSVGDSSATTGHVPVERMLLASNHRRWLRHDGACPRRAMLLAKMRHHIPATTGHVPVERCSSPAITEDGSATTGHVPVEQCSSPNCATTFPSRRGMSPSSLLLASNHRRWLRHDGACPRRAMLLATPLHLPHSRAVRFRTLPSTLYPLPHSLNSAARKKEPVMQTRPAG